MNNSNTLQVNQAHDGALIEELPLDNWDQVDTKIALAYARFNERNDWLPAHRRQAILTTLAELVRNEQEEFALLIAREGGKPLQDARIEVTRAVNGIELAREEIAQLHGQQLPMDLSAAGEGRLAFTVKEPIGVVLAVSAFNHPLNLIVHQVVPAIACGCPVIVKPAENTPLCCKRFVELVQQSGLPEGWCQFCLTDPDSRTKLVADERIAFLTFIGSARVGWELRRRIANGTRCALEHGGAAPVIVEPDADLDKTIPLISKAAYYHAGQVCVSVQRVFVHADIVDQFITRLSDQLNSLTTGDPTSPDTDVGPLIRPSEVNRVEQWVNEALSEGAELITGGKKLDDHYYAPTLLLNPAQHSKVSTQEIFGPVACIFTYQDMTEAITIANSLAFAFQSAVFTRNIDGALQAAKHFDAAAVMINDHTAFRVDWMPFAGRRQSGLGVGGIAYTMHDFTQEKLIVINSAS